MSNAFRHEFLREIAELIQEKKRILHVREKKFTKVRVRALQVKHK